MNPTIQVTINPDGVSCREVNPFGKKPREINAPEYWAGFDDDEVKEARSEYEINQREIREWNEAESTLRTFEIELPKCTCTKFFQILDCKNICECKIPELATTHTAEILETYPEPREGIFGRVKIIS